MSCNVSKIARMLRKIILIQSASMCWTITRTTSFKPPLVVGPMLGHQQYFSWHTLVSHSQCVVVGTMLGQQQNFSWFTLVSDNQYVQVGPKTVLQLVILWGQTNISTPTMTSSELLTPTISQRWPNLFLSWGNDYE